MSSHYEAPIRKPLVVGSKSYHDVTVDVAAPVEGRANKQWWIVFSIALAAFLYGLGAMGEAGVTRCLQIIEQELDLTMAFSGLSDINDVDEKVIWAPGTR